MLFYRGSFYFDSMKFLIMAEYDPSVFTTDLQPRVISHILWEVVGRAVVIFNPERRPHVGKRLRETLAEIAVEVEC